MKPASTTPLFLTIMVETGRLYSPPCSRQLQEHTQTSRVKKVF